MNKTIIYIKGKSKVTVRGTWDTFDKEKHQDLFAKYLVEILSRRLL